MIIYVIINTINGKIYIGQTTRSLSERISEHISNKKTLIGRAIQKYGWTNFSVKVIEVCDTIEQLNEREKFWIAKYDSIVPNGYNLTEGGNNGTHSADVCARLSAANTGKKLSAETCKKISEAKKGTHLSKETRAKMSAMRKGKSKSNETRARMKLAQTKNRKVVYCIETRQTFESIKAAAESYGIRSGEISSVCNGKRNTAGGLHWAFLKDWLTADDKTQTELSAKPSHRRKRVRCMETGEVFLSTRAAAEKYKTDHKNIARACKNSTRTAVGMHWKFLVD
ncbi:MAG: GIY-YIG nuclease family protein [Selenomonadaceae bacterium]|nr:GIY-YIG nuclease family protein [Selenomonadaceae bacterium]